ncbi:hypothetical protein Nepgr_016992 [Nepenthes gracilis]|uniref:RDRP C-terminal head domain-containing protein n=1 Tax=Nepenthes gracilis TaxID=150966 RepID=A0AAD3XSV9_NEPGR|nr:hypothetical protein Nepgr_016992 [Nepenthes gracilis]
MFNRKKDVEAITVAVRSLRKEARSWFNEKWGGVHSETEAACAKASAWYYVTYHPSYWGCYNEGMGRDHFLSFPWCVYDTLIHIKKLSNKRKDLDLALLNSDFRSRLSFSLYAS